MSPEQRALVAPYVTSLDSPVFVLKNLPEEVVAVLFAYYSRSREDLRSNLLKLLQEQELDVGGSLLQAPADEAGLELARRKAKEFHERWVVGYGHASVAEHAVAHVAIEDVSILASKVIEDNRLASYTEKSTRYVPFARAYYPAHELEGDAGRIYHSAVGTLFDTYETLLEPVTERVMDTADRSPFKTDRGFRNSCQAQACDALRYLLPAATYTNIGLTANARLLEHMVSKLLSHPLQELQTSGERIRDEATKVIPTLIKYARRKDYFVETPPAMRTMAKAPPAGRVGRMGEWKTPPSLASLVHSPEDPEARLAAAILYEFSEEPYEQIRKRVAALPRGDQERIITEYLQRRRTYGDEKHGYTDPPLRSLEHLEFTFEIVVDYGAYRDIQRHRMATQTTQRLTTALGYDVPELLEQYGFGERFRQAMDQAASAYETLAREFPEEAQYVVPLAFRKRVLFTWNLRELHHFISLRSARQGHISYRRVAWAVYDELKEKHPFLASFIRVDRDEYDLARPG